MNHAELCPVCKGVGELVTNYVGYTMAYTSNSKICHGCGGYGWVIVPDNSIEGEENNGSW